MNFQNKLKKYTNQEIKSFIGDGDIEYDENGCLYLPDGDYFDELGHYYDIDGYDEQGGYFDDCGKYVLPEEQEEDGELDYGFTDFSSMSKGINSKNYSKNNAITSNLIVKTEFERLKNEEINLAPIKIKKK